MKTRTWICIFAAALAVCLGTMALFGGVQDAAFARITVDGKAFKTVPLGVDTEFTVGGTNTVTVKDGAIGVTWANCPDQYCVKRGFRSGGTDIVCLPNRVVITFLGEQAVDGVS